MIKIKLLTLRGAKEPWLAAALKEYEKRLSSTCELQWILAKNGLQLEALSKAEPFLIALDPSGKQLQSIPFSEWLFKTLREQRSRLSFVIGGPDGLSSAVKKHASFLWSLSALTFTGQMSRLIVVEQLYRAFEIHKGSLYHR